MSVSGSFNQSETENTSRSILILEDYDLLRAFFSRHFEKRKFQVFSAARIEDAVALTLSLLPQVIVIDHVLLSESAIEAIKRLRSIVPGSKIIVVGGVDAPEIREAIVTAGATAFLPGEYTMQGIDEITE